MKILILCVLSILCFSSCLKQKDTELFKTPYEGNELNITLGVFSELDSVSQRMDPYFFYRDGVMIYGGAIHVDRFEEFKQNQLWEGQDLTSKTSFGVFTIDNNLIKLEDWYASNDGALKTVVQTGTVINDTSFVINHIQNNFYNSEADVEKYYYLERFSPKPDSTNTFIQ